MGGGGNSVCTVHAVTYQPQPLAEHVAEFRHSYSPPRYDSGSLGRRAQTAEPHAATNRIMTTRHLDANDIVGVSAVCMIDLKTRRRMRPFLRRRT